ncbi:MAG: lactate racemase domain-containing protein [Bacillota bacterium]
MPEVVVKPSSAEELSAILKLANREMIPVTPRGAGSGLSGGAVPLSGGILVSTERMNKIIEIDKKNLIAVLEPGVITNDFNDEVQKENLFFAGYPMSIEMCYIGGNVAENAGGGRAIKYGVTGRYITGLEVVLPSGEICTFGGKRVKDVTGYNILQLMIGSEGTLGIFSKIFVKLLPLPKAKIDMMVLFEDAQSAIDAVPLIMNTMRIIPTGIEFMDKISLDTTSEFLNEKKRYEDAGAILIIELDGNDADQIREECLDIGELCLDNGALDAFVAEGPADQEKIWKVCRHAAEAFKAISPVQSLEDIVVPVSNIPELLPLPGSDSEEKLINDALAKPVDSPPLSQLVNKGEKACIIIGDMTRVWARYHLLVPPLLDHLNRGGIPDENVIIISATSDHREQSADEHRTLVGDEVYDRVKVVDHRAREADNMVYMGDTSYGTPVFTNRQVAEADRVILTGGIVYHFLAGWGDGKKAIIPGVAGYKTIMKNHSLVFHPEEGCGLNPAVCQRMP